MNRYIVRWPIKDLQGKIIGHEILYHGENEAFGSDSANEFAAADTIYSFLTRNSEKVLRNTLNFMNFTLNLLVKKTPRLFDKNELVIQIDDSVIIHPFAMHLVQQYAAEGYAIAVNDFQFAPRYLSLMEYIQYIRINVKTTSKSTATNIVQVARSMNKKCIATDVDCEELHQVAADLGVDAVQGPYVSEKMETEAKPASYLQGNFFRLVVEVTKDEPNVDEIEHLISMDATLTYGLLRVVNSAYFALRTRATSIKHAIMTMGLSQLKRWIYLISMSNAEGDGQLSLEQEEFLRVSFMRASFCSELVQHAYDIPISTSEAYLMGMFSTMNYLVDAPLEEILRQVPMSDAVRAALLNHEGRCGMLYDLVLSYEKADWPQIAKLAQELRIPNEMLTVVYFNCMEEVNHTWEQLMSSYNREDSGDAND